MKVFYITSSNPFTGRNHAALRVLECLNYWRNSLKWNIHICSLNFDTPQTQVIDHKEFGKDIQISVSQFRKRLPERVQKFPLSHHQKIWSSRAIQFLDGLVRQNGPFDVTLSEELASAVAVSHLEPHHLGRTVYIAHNVEWDLSRQLLGTERLQNRIKLNSLFKAEKSIINSFKEIFAFSRDDRQLLQSLYQRDDIRETHSGVSLHDISNKTLIEKSQNLLFIGSLSYAPNVLGLGWFAKNIFPLLKTKFHVIVAGSNPTEEVQAICNSFDFELIDTPLYMRDVRARGGIEIVPLRHGSGTRGKIVEALAAGLPVVSTSLGAKGLELKDRQHLLIADTPAHFADRIHEISENLSLARQLSEAGICWAKNFSYPKIAQDLASALA